MFGYFVWAFGSSFGWLEEYVSEWAFRLPVIVAVYVILLIVLWIGYTMATTPPPMPIERPLEIEREEASGLARDRGEEESEGRG